MMIRSVLYVAAMAVALTTVNVNAQGGDELFNSCEHCSNCYHEKDVPTHFGVTGHFKTLDVSYFDDTFDLTSPAKCDSCLGNMHRAIYFMIRELPQVANALWISNPGGIVTGAYFDRRYRTTSDTVIALDRNDQGWVSPCDPTQGNPSSNMCELYKENGEDPVYFADWLQGAANNQFKSILTGCDYWPEKKQVTETWILAKFPGDDAQPNGNWLEFQVGSSDFDDCFVSHVSPDCPTSPPPGEAEEAVLFRSVAHRFVSLCLNAIRREIPDPTQHARNLYHLSAAVWDAWAAYDDTYSTTGFLFQGERPSSSNLVADRDKAVAYAGYGILSHRYSENSDTKIEIDDAMNALGYNPNLNGDGSTPALIGTKIANAIIAYGYEDNSNEQNGFADTTNYASVNKPLFLNTSGTIMNDPNRWQPLAFDNFVTQNGIEQGAWTQTFQGPHWGYVTPFALNATTDLTLVGDHALPVWLDQGPPPAITTDEARNNILEVIELNSYLDIYDNTTIDISPCCMHNNPLGENNGTGYPVNPVTDDVYANEVVYRADYGRVVAEYWADGPESETPPGHWNVIAHQVRMHDAFQRKWMGEGDDVIDDDLEWDVKSGLILNGALHDAAIAAWSHKRAYDYSRPISQIRYMGGKGQCTDDSKASYHVEGLPLKAGLVEEITDATVQSYHSHLSAHVGKIAVRCWRPPSANGVEWILAQDWSPYQRSTFVTPAFAGYVSGHSTFSRAAAEVLANITGTKYFPGGLSEYQEKAGDLEFDYGPLTDVALSHATYYDAADEAGRSRLYGGIHPVQDDLPGRILGYEVSKRACEAAARYFQTPSAIIIHPRSSNQPTGEPSSLPSSPPTEHSTVHNTGSPTVASFDATISQMPTNYSKQPTGIPTKNPTEHNIHTGAPTVASSRFQDNPQPPSSCKSFLCRVKDFFFSKIFFWM